MAPYEMSKSLEIRRIFEDRGLGSYKIGGSYGRVVLRNVILPNSRVDHVERLLGISKLKTQSV